MTRNGLDGEKTESGRAKAGRFAPGNPGGPGRPNKPTERLYMVTLSQRCDPEQWGKIVDRAVTDATNGDRAAREWLSHYLLGRPEAVAPSLHQLAVEEAAGTDPVAQDAYVANLMKF